MKNHIVLYEPLMPANTGNIARTCAGTNTTLHLIEPLGFSTDDKMLKRAGLDYWDKVEVLYHKNLEAFLEYFADQPNAELHLVTKFADNTYADIDYNDKKNHFFIFGKETTGLPEEFMKEHAESCIRLPMNDEHVRSLNLSNVACMVVYEALRQQEFRGLELTHQYENHKL
ncbi:MAG: tRNA (uridine(34)/cytosine(34)/5-carboxymethylaminomethyluridine(34)-2'-O)-methyltransferase TrmL [Lactobacillales bacterium]|jgi:tRNA (cytidine/uridine-2'-O-)-methyltransferase|nr:tRNA (uridine(34)/cytosine(34)/5-carboxymethylaminomethyluridine(34)-2'-O)-methyltransferase TrmL [Lactobacillales bacterium]